MDLRDRLSQGVEGEGALARSGCPTTDLEFEASRRRPEPDAHFSTSDCAEALREAMATLSAEHRAVVDLTYFHGMGYRQIAEIVECPVDTVKTRMFHARRRLKQALPGGLSDWL